MHIRLSAIALSFLALTLMAGRAEAQVAAEDHAVELGVMLWKPTPEITLSTDALAGTGIDTVDFVQEFGIAEEWFPEFRLVAGRSHKFRLSYVQMKYDAEATLERTITFRGQTFTIGAPATADIKWDLWRFGYEWDFVRADRGYLGAVVDVKYNKIVASVDSPLLTSAGRCPSSC